MDNDTIFTVSSRFFEYLIFVLAYSSIIHGSVQGMFRFLRLSLSDTWIDEALVMVLALFFAIGLDWNAFAYIGNFPPDQYVTARGVWKELGVPGAALPAGLVFLLGNIVTAAMVVIGRKGVVAIAEEFKRGKAVIWDKKVNGG